MRLGSDPEVFLQDQQGKLISVIGKIGAGKHNPFQIPDLPQGFTLQEDNVALEFGIPPASTANEFVKHILTVQKAGLSKLPGLQFSNISCTIFPPDQMDHPEAFIFGCEPDYNAWTGEKNPKPKPPHPYMRSAGGHVHIETKLDAKDVGRACDMFLGIPSVLMDKDEKRKQLYGKAGSIRFKPYGVEYRTLSNFWIFDEPLIRWVWRNTKRALADIEVHNGGPGGSLGLDIQDCINNNNKKLACKLVSQFDLEVI
jgi:hypothetical protein